MNFPLSVFRKVVGSRNNGMDSVSILDLPIEIITEIFTYLSWFEVTEACLVCRSWLKIGQQQKFATKRYLKFIHCNLNDDTEPGRILINSKNAYYGMRIGKSCYVTRNSLGFFGKLGQNITTLELTGNLEWESGLLPTVLELFPSLEVLKVGLALSDQVNTTNFVKILFEKRFKRVSLHGLTQKFIDNFWEHTKNGPIGTEFHLFFNCDFDSRGKFDTFFETLAKNHPNHAVRELTVPFKYRALEMLSQIPLNFHQLSKLEITSPKSFEDLKKICQLMSNLQELVLWRGCLDFQLFDVFDCLSNLEVLRIQSGLRFTQTTDFCEFLKPKPKMRVLDMELIEGEINESGFERLIKAMPNLEELILAQSDVRDPHLAVICDNLRHMRVLEIDCKKITDMGILDANINNLRTLKRLKLDGGYGITSEAFKNFPQNHFSDLIELKLNYFPKIDTTGVDYLINSCSNLKYLSLDGCSEVDDSTIQSVTQKLRHLRHLDLFSCPKITFEAILNIDRALHFIDLSGMNPDETEKQLLYEKIPSLRYIYDYDDGIDKSKYFKGKTLRKRELYCTLNF